ncbi:thiamine pyrophosphate-dependent enzyme [Maritimibacter sp. UBA3975]|uniref:thiamine pyrophosphate-dependent enzyme n=1 Tax=Maritimibacter sp. UBA3975 TaxID=1946833 RepID=UPI000C09FB08|nr:thiamine pyrophosphate-dependent enzyme [Maritimibacter sp. UBA3975]MAM62345.1 TPP-binding protein [Maritimibacter sp.]|tara:strand:- start:2680 stop:4293 length:1614 start_codon:yes stop_codon:yes gene_type:complete
MTETVAKRMVGRLIEEGFSRIYCLPGVQNDDFFDVLYDEQEKLVPIHTRHEQGAAYMALGAAMATGKPQVCCIVPGPGFLNATAALSTAWAVNAPVFMLVGQTSAWGYGKELGELHEIPDQLSILSQLTKSAGRLDEGETGGEVIDKAMKALVSGRPRPVGIEVPVDVWTQDCAPGAVPATAKPTIDADDLKRAAELIRVAKRPMIVVGSGALDHSGAVQALAAKIGAPVAANRTGRGVVPASDPASLLPPVARRLWPEIDLVIGLGTRLGAKLAQWGVDGDLASIHIDVDPPEFLRGQSADVQVLADLADALPDLTARAETNNRPDWQGQVAIMRAAVQAELAKTLAPQKAWLDVIVRYLGPEGILVSDLTQVGYVAEAMYPVERPRGYLSPGYQGTLGWSVATGLGAADACRDRKVVTIAGDGGGMFTIQELATAKQHDIPAQTIIFNDNCFANVQRFQIHKYGNRPIASDLDNPDFVELAQAFGIRGARAETPDELTACLKEGHAAGGPGLIEVPVGEFPSPWAFIGPRKLRGI